MVLDKFCQTKVQQLYEIVIVQHPLDHDVFRLDVAVNYPLPMGGFQGIQGLTNNMIDQGNRHRSLVEHSLKQLHFQVPRPFNIFHYKKGASRMGSILEQANNIGVRQRCEGRGFPFELSDYDRLPIGRNLLHGQDLQGRLEHDRYLKCQIYSSEASRPDPCCQKVIIHLLTHKRIKIERSV